MWAKLCFAEELSWKLGACFALSGPVFQISFEIIRQTFITPSDVYCWQKLCGRVSFTSLCCMHRIYAYEDDLINMRLVWTKGR